MIDLSTVKQIVIPEGEVSQIASNGIVLWAKPAEIPSEYQRIAYIEATGTQYITTPHKATQNTRMVLDCEPTTVDAYNRIAGARQSTTSKAFAIEITNTGYWRIGYGSRSPTLDIQADTLRHTLDLNKNVFSVDGVVLHTAAEAPFTGSYNLRIGCIYGAGQMYPGYVKIYSCKIYEDGIMIHNFVPCYRKADNKPGMYDTATKTFHVNVGTGEFLYGLPVEYQEVEYLESTGTQYIDTGFKPNQDTRVVMDAEGTRPSGHTKSTLFAYFGARNTDLQFDLYDGSSLNWNLYYYFGPENTRFTDFTSVNDYNTRHILEINRNTAAVDDVTKTVTDSEWQLDYNLFLFASNTSGTASGIAPMKLYSCQIYDNDVLIREYVPCYRKADRKPGLYDRVSGEFHTNAGTDEFILGEVV